MKLAREGASNGIIDPKTKDLTLPDRRLFSQPLTTLHPKPKTDKAFGMDKEYLWEKAIAELTFLAEAINSNSGIGDTSTPWWKVRFANSNPDPLGDRMDL